MPTPRRATRRRLAVLTLVSVLAVLGQQTLAAAAPHPTGGPAGSGVFPDMFRPAPTPPINIRYPRWGGGYTEFPTPAAHDAFPGTTLTPHGELQMVWRQGTAHRGQDGRIYTSFGDPTARSWTQPTQIPLPVVGDLRDPHVSTIGGVVWLTFCMVDANGVFSGAYATKSVDGGHTFGPVVRIDPAMPWAAVSSPILATDRGLVSAYFGKLAGETWFSTWLATSTDGGATWTSRRVANGQAAGRDYEEPWLLRRGTQLVMLHRYGTWDAIGATTSIDSGGTWSAPRRVVENAANNSASVWASDGTIYLIVRDRATREAVLVTSVDQGVTFQRGRVVLSKPVGANAMGMTYAAPIELGGRIFAPIAYEVAPTDSRLYLGWLT